MRYSGISKAISVVCSAIILAVDASNSCCQTIVLRDLQLIEGADVAAMTVEGVTLADGRNWRWDQIQEGDVGPQWQSEFERWLKEIGEPLFRVRQRLASRDYSSLQPHADELASHAIQYESTSSVYYLACCAKVRSALDQQQREAALVPLLELLRVRNEARTFHDIEELSELHFAESRLCDELLPVWFDADAAREQLAQIRKSARVPKAIPGDAAYIYLNTLAIAAGESAIPVENSPSDDPWRLIYSAQSALLAGNNEQVARELDADLFRDSAERHAIALYYLGTAQSQMEPQSVDSNVNTNRALWMLTLLKIPALYEDRFIELSAAAVSAVVNHPDSASQVDFEHLRSELAGRYRQTTFGTSRK